MIKLLSTTNAYKVIRGDKAQNSLSHAYLVDTEDKDSLRDFLKCLAKLILCDSEDFCDSCRVCRLIDRETHPDVTIYPNVGEKLKAQHADEITANCLIKPLELQKRVFIISGFEGLEKSQNKLLKTLEEPPKNVILLLGTSNLSGILPTVKSRTKKIDIPSFSNEKLLEYFKDKLLDEEKLNSSVLTANGILSLVVKNYESGDFQDIKEKVVKTLLKLNSSKDAISAFDIINGLDAKKTISTIKLVFGELLKYKSGRISRLIDKNTMETLDERFKTGAVIEIIEGLSEIERSLHFNANQTMVFDKALFLILEAKHRWLKL